ncbi:calcium-activated chloride channel-domain-containing protein [Gaertneriomyces semiglobifer]|nr:calcium-activated chloride channel-domain-containing protein [Gaertneriomyces semiglobifer]
MASVDSAPSERIPSGRSSLIPGMESRRSQRRSTDSSKDASNVLPVTLIKIGTREILLQSAQDVEMFEFILSRKAVGVPYETALDLLCPIGGDALVKVAYADAETAWDTVLMFHIKKDHRHARLRTAFEHALLQEGLILERESYAGDHSIVFLKMMTPFDRLCVEAEKIKLKRPMKHDETPSANTQAKALAIADFLDTERVWDNVKSTAVRSTRSKRRSLTFNKRNLMAILGSSSETYPSKEVQLTLFDNGHRNLLTYNIIRHARMRTLGKKYLRKDFNKLLDEGVYSDIFPLHDGPVKLRPGRSPNKRSQLYELWCRSIYKVPLEDLRDYFGEKIALYFAFVGHLGAWFGLAALMGAGVFIYGVIKAVHEGHFEIPDGIADVPSSLELNSAMSTIFDNVLTLPWAFALSVWAMAYLEFWKRRNNTLAYTWDVLQFETEEGTRPQWYGTVIRQSEVTGQNEPYFPRPWRQVFYTITGCIMVLTLLVVIGAIAGFIFFASFMRWYLRDTDKARYASVISACVSLATIMILRPLLTRLSRVLTDFENHKTETQYQDAFTTKALLFEFINTFGSLFYIALLKVWVMKKHITIFNRSDWDDTCIYGNCMVELTVQMAVVFMGSGFVEHVTKYFWPLFDKRFRKKVKSAKHLAGLTDEVDDVEAGKGKVPKLPKWEEDAKLVPLRAESAFEYGYNMTVLQFAFIVLFAVAFPLAPLFAIVHNALRMRIDMQNLLTKYRRPFALQAQDIGVRQTYITAISWMAVIVNACTIAFSSKYFDENYLNLFGESKEAQWAVRLGFIVIFEHAVVGVKALVAYMVPDIPREVKIGLRRAEYLAKRELDASEEEEPNEDELGKMICIIL